MSHYRSPCKILPAEKDGSQNSSSASGCLKSGAETVVMEWENETGKKKKPLEKDLPNYSGQLELNLTGELWGTVLNGSSGILLLRAEGTGLYYIPTLSKFLECCFLASVNSLAFPCGPAEMALVARKKLSGKEMQRLVFITRVSMLWNGKVWEAWKSTDSIFYNETGNLDFVQQTLGCHRQLSECKIENVKHDFESHRHWRRKLHWDLSTWQALSLTLHIWPFV